ncbi:MAG: hypothetical protein H6642_10700 [Caldilineaceae bacterium]|nr:hypothetical protein [Caldilineaceae bacterium]
MKKYLFMTTAIFVGVIAWRIGERLSSDAISMGLGVIFGVMAGVPTAILVMAGNRRRERDDAAGGRGGRGSVPPSYPQFSSQPPVIVLTGAGMLPQQPPGAGQGYGPPYAGQGEANDWPPRPTERRFKMVGEREEWIDEW